MSEDWPADRPMCTPDDILEAFDQDDLDGLADEFEGRLIDVGPLHWQWESEDGSLRAWLSNGFIGGTSLELELPISETALLSALGDLNERLQFRSDAANLPSLDLFDENDAAECSRALADFFGVQLRDFTDTLCGGWVPVDDACLTGFGEIPLRWFGTGTPLQALLGIGEDFATLARPIEVAGGLAGPPRLEADQLVDIDLRRGRLTLEGLADALPPILASSRSRWEHCRGCLTFGPLNSSGYCGGCQYLYLGLIVD